MCKVHPCCRKTPGIAIVRLFYSPSSVAYAFVMGSFPGARIPLNGMLAIQTKAIKRKEVVNFAVHRGHGTFFLTLENWHDIFASSLYCHNFDSTTSIITFFSPIITLAHFKMTQVPQELTIKRQDQAHQNDDPSYGSSDDESQTGDVNDLPQSAYLLTFLRRSDLATPNGIGQSCPNLVYEESNTEEEEVPRHTVKTIKPRVISAECTRSKTKAAYGRYIIQPLPMPPRLPRVGAGHVFRSTRTTRVKRALIN